jgi:hypothetical protein
MTRNCNLPRFTAAKRTTTQRGKELTALLLASCALILAQGRNQPLDEYSLLIRFLLKMPPFITGKA